MNKDEIICEIFENIKNIYEITSLKIFKNKFNELIKDNSLQNKYKNNFTK